MSQAAPQLAHALAYAAMGWPVLPLRPGTKAPALPPPGFHLASTDPSQVREWFEAAPDYGVGIRPGPAGLVALDVDDKDGKTGSLELEALEGQHGRLPPTLVQRTPSGSRHLFFALPKGMTVGNANLTPSIDVRSDAGYVAAEPTVIDGTSYAFLDWDILAGESPQVAQAPAWLVAILAIRSAPPARNAGVGLEAVTQFADARTIAELRSALNALDPDPYQGWIDCGIRLKGLGNAGRELWMTWSQQSPKFDPREAAQKWASFTASQTGYQAVFTAAHAAGWVNPRSRGASLNGHAAPAANETLGPHPLAQWVEVDAEPIAPRWVIPGFIAQGLVMIAGAHGGGKTTALLPLALVAAGLHAPGDPLAPLHWRRVVYVTEDVEQARRILAGLMKYADHRLPLDLVRDRMRLVEARRLPLDQVVDVASEYAALTRNVEHVAVPPLIVFDTKSAVLELKEENSNSEASDAVAMFKQRFEGLPVWLVAHVAKASLSHNEVAGLTVRGASAWEADANQVLYLITEGETRYLTRGKTRFEAQWQELEIKPHTLQVMVRDQFGGVEPLTLRWSKPVPPEVPRHEAIELAQQEVKKRAAAELRMRILDAVHAGLEAENPLNRTRVKDRLGGNSGRIGLAIESLVSEGWLHEVEVPTAMRKNNNQLRFLVALTTHEHDEWLRTKALPEEKLRPPAAWRKLSEPVCSQSERTEAVQGELAPSQKSDSVRSKSVRPPKGKNGRNERRGLECPLPVPLVPIEAGMPGTNGNERERTAVEEGGEVEV